MCLILLSYIFFMSFILYLIGLKKSREAFMTLLAKNIMSFMGSQPCKIQTLLISAEQNFTRLISFFKIHFF